MASNQPIERLYVKLEADVRDLLTEGEDAIKKLEREMNKLDKTGKRVGRFPQLRRGLDRVVSSLQAAQAAALAFGAALVTAVKLAQQAIIDIRVERSFYRLAAAAGESGNDIIDAMERASNFTVDRITLMRLANLALQLNVAQTSEEFERMTRAAVTLGAAMGRGPADAIERLIAGAGKREQELLDELGFTTAQLNDQMDRFARQDFGKPASGLTVVQRNALFVKSVLELAAERAEVLGNNTEDAGTGMEQIQANWKNFKSELGKTALIFISIIQQMSEGPGLLQRLTEGAIAWQTVLVQIAALIMTIEDSLDRIGLKIKDFWKPFSLPLSPGGAGVKSAGLIGKLLSGEPITDEDLPSLFKIQKNIAEGIAGGFQDAEEEAGQAGEEGGKSFAERFINNLEALEDKFKDILDPEAAAGLTPGPEIDPDPTEESADEIRDILRGLTTDMIDASEERQDALEQLEQDHNERLADIAADGARRRAQIEQDYQQDLEELARETAQRREEIFRDTQRDLERLARETDERLADEREDFQTEERRETEDHLREMRRLTEDYLFDLDDAVKNRDARAVVDLQRRFALEQQRKEEDFQVGQQRDREDYDRRLQEIRENEARRREEILAQQAQELQDLMVHEAERRAEIDASYQEQIVRLDEQMAEARAREQENYAERKADLDAALAERLKAIAKELADEEKINEEGARRILKALNDYFGVGGEIDDLMEDFIKRRSQTMRVEISFDASTQGAQQSLGSSLPGGSGYGRLPRFQHGGTLLARRPTLAMFGEAGPEVAQFTPLSQLGRGSGQPRRVQIEFSGSAPPGIRATERDQIATVLLDALRDTGVMG